MMRRKVPFAIGAWHHCYNWSIEGRTSFVDSRDYYRFLELLYLANDEFPLRRDDIGIRKFEEVLAVPRGKRIVTVGAFSLMPNHFHLALKETVAGGITTFMRKLGTSYTLYFNSRHKRMGNLFLKPFRSLHVPTDRRLQQLVSYIHCAPATLIDPRWKNGPVVDPQFLGEHLAAYPYSSIGAFTAATAQISPIVDAETFPMAHAVPIQKMLLEARGYSADSNIRS